MSVVGATTEVEFQFGVWSSGGGWRGRGVSWSNVAAGRFPAFLHFWQTNRPARSCTNVVGTWRNAHKSTSVSSSKHDEIER